MDQIDNIRERLRENRNYHAVGGRYSIEQRRALLRRLIAEKLTKREADILRRRYGLDGRLPQTQRQVAADYGISRSYVSRLEKKALGKLEEALRERM